MAIGIYGEWGEGKTSLMHLIKRSLDTEDSEIATVWFNAWRYTKEKHPVFPLAISIIDALEKNKKLSGKAREKANSIVGALSSLVSGVKLKIAAKNEFIGEVQVEYDPDKALQREKKRQGSSKAFSSLYFDVFRQLEKVNLGTEGEKVVVFIDDLDRCMPHHAITLLESIKLTFGITGFVFVLGVARASLDSYVERIYKEEYGIKKFDGAAYLDKIIQLSFFIPPHGPRFSDYLRVLISRVALPPGTGFKDLLELVQIASRNNPRSAISFINNLLIDKEILASLQSGRQSVPEVNIGTFAILRAIQKSRGDLLPSLINIGSRCKEIAQWQDKEIDEVAIREATNVDEKHFVTIAKALKSDFTLKRLLYSDYGKEWLINDNERKFAIHFLSSQRGELVETLKISKEGIKVYVCIFNKIDNKAVKDILFAIHEAGVSPVTTENIGNHKSWHDAIVENLNTCQAFLCFIGKSESQTRISTLELRVAMELAETYAIQKCIVFLPSSTKKGVEDIVGDLGEFSMTRLTKKDVESRDYRKVMRSILH
jgi:hypothetical protein